MVVATTVVISAAIAHAQTADLAADNAAASPPEKKINLPRNNVVRYSAGDSIPLGLPHKTQQDRVLETTPAVIAPVQTKVVRYSAGDSIPLGSSAAVQAGSRVAAQTATQKKSAGYSAASNIPLAGAFGDSVTTHIGVSQAGLAEANGLISTTPAGLVGLFVVKAGMVYYFEHQKPEVRKAGLKTAAGVWSGFTMNNLLLIAGSTNPVSLVGGALFGAYMYHREGITLEMQAATRTAQGFQLQAR